MSFRVKESGALARLIPVAGILFAGLTIDAFAQLPEEGFQSYVKSSESVQDVLKGSKNQPKSDTYYLLALDYAKRGAMDAAMMTIGRGLSLEPGNTKLMNLKAAMWARAGKTLEAVAEFRRVLAISPENSYARDALFALIGPEKPAPKILPSAKPPTKALPPGGPKTASDSASVATSPARLLEPSYFEKMNTKQRCFFSLAAMKRAQESREKSKPETKGKFDLDALVEEKLLPSKPVCPEAGSYSWKGENPTCSKHGDLGALESEVKTIFSDYNQGMKAKFGRNYPEARTAFKRVLMMYPKWSEAFYQLADTCFRMGEDKEAIASLRSCLEIEEKNNDAKLLLANLYFKTGLKDSALKILDSVEKNSAGTVHGLSAKSLGKAIRSGKNYYQIFPPE